MKRWKLAVPMFPQGLYKPKTILPLNQNIKISKPISKTQLSMELLCSCNRKKNYFLSYVKFLLKKLQFIFTLLIKMHNLTPS